MPTESLSRLIAISRCRCGAEMSLKTIERRSAIVEVRIFACGQCLRELRVHLSSDEASGHRPAATGL
jgi:hypothetical protein